jgi:hypothetical protein
MYNGLRQLLFTIPAIALLATVAFSAMLAVARTRWGPRRAWIVAGVTAIALVVPMTNQAMLFPYAAEYYTVAGEFKNKTLTRWGFETPQVGDDVGAYGSTATRELAGDVAPNAILVCEELEVMRQANYSISGANEQCLHLRTLLPYVGDGTGATKHDSILLVNDPDLDPTLPLTDNCQDVRILTRRDLQRTYGIATLRSCTSNLPELELNTTYNFAGTNHRDLLGWNWSYPDPGGLWSRDEYATLVFAAPSQDMGISITGMRFLPPGESRDVEILINGVSATRATFSTAWEAKELRLWVSPESAAADGTVTITIRAPGPVRPRDYDMGSNAEALAFYLQTLSTYPVGP